MAARTYIAPLDDMRFALATHGNLHNAREWEIFASFDDGLIDAIMNEAATFAQDKLSPLNAQGDLEGCRVDGGQVHVPQAFIDAYRAFVAGGWNAAPFPQHVGGQGLPQPVAAMVSEMWHGANVSFALCPLLTQSAVHLLMQAGSEWHQRVLLPKLVEGEWTGTMCMTEPQAGSDVGACRAQATPAGDGTYRIKGTKIFISCGDHDMSHNIIHMVLARLPDAPAGSAGLSLFVVPKFLVDEAGNMGTANDVRAVSIEHKMGMHASPTCVMAFGDGEGAIGTLVGKPGEGLKTMFTMMNSARLGVGLEALGIAEYACQLAHTYAAERIQSKPLASEKNASPVTIDQHGDVARMLRWITSHTQALRGLSAYVSALEDASLHHPDESARYHAKNRLDLLIPVMKAHTTATAFDITSHAMQVHGGLGYIEETGIAQLMRDVRVTMIYEGTNGIQALDLVHRKLPMEHGQVLARLIADMQKTAERLIATEGSAHYRLHPLGEALARSLRHLEDAARNMLLQVQRSLHNTEGDAPSGVSAHAFLTLLGLVTEGWLLAEQVLAAPAWESHHSGQQGFAAGKEATARFFLMDILLDTASLKERVLLGNTALYGHDPLPT